MLYKGSIDFMAISYFDFTNRVTFNLKIIFSQIQFHSPMNLKSAKEIKKAADQALAGATKKMNNVNLQSFTLEEKAIQGVLDGATTPMITGLVAPITGVEGEVLPLIPTLDNPDKGEDLGGLFLTLFFGAANALEDNAFLQAMAAASANLDAEWPYISSERLSLAAGETRAESWSFQIPVGIPQTTYFGNIALWQINLIGQGRLLARAGFHLTVSSAF